MKMYKILVVLLFSNSVYGWAFPRDEEAKVKPETLNKLLEEKNYKEFAQLLGIKEEKYVKPIEDPTKDDRKYRKSSCVTDFIYTFKKRDKKAIAERYWPKSGNVTWIPFYAPPSDYVTKRIIDMALRGTWAKYFPYVRFKLYEGEADYVYAFKGPSVFADIGRRGGPQALSINEECDIWEVLHLAMHVAGFPHEHNRRDRWKYMTVLEDNLVEGGEIAYKLYAKNAFEDIMAHFRQGEDQMYDFFSLTHFSEREFAKPYEKAFVVSTDPTIKDLDKLVDMRNKRIGMISLYDEVKLRYVYG